MACLQRWNYCSVTVPTRHFVMQRARPPWTWQILNSQRLGRCWRNILSAANARFMSEDPKLFDAGDYNLFRYCHNDPVDNVDPMGLEENLAQKPISAWDPTGRAWLKQFRDGVQEVLRQIARQQ